VGANIMTNGANGMVIATPYTATTAENHHLNNVRMDNNNTSSLLRKPERRRAEPGGRTRPLEPDLPITPRHRDVPRCIECRMRIE
jgi:hypothetical protein